MFEVIKVGRKLLGFKNTNGMLLEVGAKSTGVLVTEEATQQQVLSREMQL